MIFITLCIIAYVALVIYDTKDKAYQAEIDRQSAIETAEYHRKIAEIDAQIAQTEKDFAWLDKPSLLASE